MSFLKAESRESVKAEKLEPLQRDRVESGGGGGVAVKVQREGGSRGLKSQKTHRIMDIMKRADI